MTLLKTYITRIPGKIIINGGYLVLQQPNKCTSIVPNCLSTVKTTKTPNQFPSISITTNFKDAAEFYFDKIFYSKEDLQPSMEYSLKIINTFYEETNCTPKNKIEIHIDLNDVLFSEKNIFIKDSVKTGLGSSCVFLIGIVDALLDEKIEASRYLKLCLNINSRLSPISSGCDIASCLFGNMNYMKYTIDKTNKYDNFGLLLGSLNESTNTRTMLASKIKEWKGLARINEQILNIEKFDSDEIKKAYEIYLDKLREIGGDIVPDRQYLILKNMFQYKIVGCGVSGSGGEDCVWCLVEKGKKDEIIAQWKNNFIFSLYIDDLTGKGDLHNILK